MYESFFSNLDEFEKALAPDTTTVEATIGANLRG
jgi:hypothetical protein